MTVIEQLKIEIWANVPIQRIIMSNKASCKAKSFPTYWMATVIFFVVGFSLYYFTITKTNKSKIAVKSYDIPVGTTKANLTLANGHTIVLEKASKGILFNQNGTTIIKTAPGQIAYTIHQRQQPQINTLTVPIGGYYALTLEDGTKVWLNSKSSLTYPTSFNNKERIVELKGEGYFEVAYRPEQPFTVKVVGQQIKAWGTHFNVNAYSDEAVTSTALLAGSIKLIANNGLYQMLKPGEKGLFNQRSFAVQRANVKDEIDWVNNDFIFNNTNLGALLRKIERWYDVEVNYPGSMDGLRLSGKISRMKSIKQVLHNIAISASLKFKIKGRRIIIMP